jgi:hypothetical protein
MDIKAFKFSWSWIFYFAVSNGSDDNRLLMIHPGIRTNEVDEVQMLELTIERLQLQLQSAAAHMSKFIH